MDMFDFFTKHIETIMFVFYSLMLLICGFCLGKIFGDMNSIRDDLKSLDYDRISMENKQLKDAIEIKRNKKWRGI